MKLLAGAVFILFLLIQISGVNFLSIWGIAPDLILCFCLAVVILKGFDRAWWFFLLAGFLLDLYSDLPFGLEALSLVLTAYSVDWFSQKVFSMQRFWTRACLAGVGVIVYYTVILFGSEIFEIAFSLSWGYFAGALAYNLILTLFLVYGFEKIFYQKKAKRNH